MNEKITLLNNKLNNFQINLNLKQQEQLEEYVSYLEEYNKHTNLVSSNDINLLYEKHLYDSFSFGKYFQNDNSYKIIDIGSGGGFPIIPIAIAMQKSSIISVDSTRKKTDFLKQVAKRLHLTNLEIINDRAENLAYIKTFRESFDIATSRAVGNLSIISELCLPFLKVGGYFYAYKATKVEEELILAQNAMTILGGTVESSYEYELNINENFARNLLQIKKIKATPSIYPRSFSAIKNNPIKDINENL